MKWIKHSTQSEKKQENILGIYTLKYKLIPHSVSVIIVLGGQRCSGGHLWGGFPKGTVWMIEGPRNGCDCEKLQWSVSDAHWNKWSQERFEFRLWSTEDALQDDGGGPKTKSWEWEPGPREGRAQKAPVTGIRSVNHPRDTGSSALERWGNCTRASCAPAVPVGRQGRSHQTAERQLVVKRTCRNWRS